MHQRTGGDFLGFGTADAIYNLLRYYSPISNSTPNLNTDSEGNRRWGLKGWYINGERHRTDGPAIEGGQGTKIWYLNDRRHRTDGPAVEYPDGTKEWWVNEQHISKPYYQVLTVAFDRSLPIPPEIFPGIIRAMCQAHTTAEHVGCLHRILHKYWPMDVQKILVTLFIDPDPTIKHLAFSLLGGKGMPGEATRSVAPLAQIPPSSAGRGCSYNSYGIRTILR